MTLLRRATVADAAAIARIHIDSWREAFVPVMTPEQVALKNLDYDDQYQLWLPRLTVEENHTRYTVVAENDAGQVTGFTTGRKNETGIAEYDAELHQIYVAPNGQRQGIGEKMVRTLAVVLHEAGYQSLIVWVMTQNPAIPFYRDRLGGTYITERIIPDADGILKEAAYGWLDMTQLFEGES